MSNTSSFAPPVESRVLGLVTTPSGASPLAGHPEFLAYCAEQGVDTDSKIAQLFFSQGCRAAPDCVPLTMSGDAWESAANHVIALREKSSPNADIWHQIGSFLQDLCKRPEPCLFPQPPHGLAVHPVGTGTEFLLPRGHCELRDGFDMEHPIDAPLWLPLGGSVAFPRFGQIGSFESVTCARGSFW